MKHTKFLYLAALILLSAGMSCDRDQKTTIEPEGEDGPTTAVGKIISYETKEPIAYATAYLNRQHRDHSSSMGMQLVEKQVTNENGEFSFAFEGEREYFYEISGKAEHYFDYGFPAEVIPGERNIGLINSLKAKGYIRYNIVNEPPLDTASINIASIYNEEMYNQYTDTIIYGASTIKKDDVEVFWITKKGTKARLLLPVALQPLDTIELIVPY